MEDYRRQAVGMLEVDDLVTCFVAMDAATKTAAVTIQNIERDRLGTGAVFKIRGRVSDVEQAMEVAVEKAGQVGSVVAHTVIASPDEDAEPAFYMTVNK